MTIFDFGLLLHVPAPSPVPTPHAGVPGEVYPHPEAFPPEALPRGLFPTSTPPSTRQTHPCGPACLSSSGLPAEIDPE
jgi:hypothetical protein